jgi:hypothetical protein
MNFSNSVPKDLQDKVQKIEEEQVKKLIEAGKLKKPKLAFLHPTNNYIIRTATGQIKTKTKRCFIQYDGANSPHEIFFSEDNGKTYNHIYSEQIGFYKEIKIELLYL